MIDNLMPDIPRIYTAIAEWLACMLFILPLKKRFSRGRTIGIMVMAIVIQSAFLIATGDLVIYLWIPCMIAAVILMIAFINICCDINVMDAAYFGMIAFVVAEFMASVEWQILCFFWKKVPSVWIQAIMLVVIYGAVALILLRLIHMHLPKDAKMDISLREYFSGLLIAVAVFAVSNMSYLTINTPFSGRYSFEVGNIRTLVDLGGIAILYAHLIQCCELRVRKELEAVQNVLQNQYVQYKQSRESIELINYKYHDLKHQIAFLRSCQAGGISKPDGG